MTTAEFAKANLAALEEPVSVRRYTKSIGVYYPQGYEPPIAMVNLGESPSPEQVEALRQQLTLQVVPDVELEATTKVIADLEAEVAHLKKELAKRPVAVMQNPRPVDAVSKTTIPGLAKQDADFFDRKLGAKASKKR